MRKSLLLSALFIVILLSVSTAVAAPIEALFAETDVIIVANGKVVELERQPVAIGGRVLAPASTVFQSVGASVYDDSENSLVEITLNDIKVTVQAGNSNVRVNDEEVITDIPPIILEGTFMIPVRFAAEALKLEIEWDGDQRAVYVGPYEKKADISRGGKKDPIVVIDPGHGGKDPGARYGGVKEKDLNLDVAKRLEKLLKAKGIKTYMTRTGDRFIGLYDRSEMANRLDADLLISIHHNAGRSSTSGSMTLYYPVEGGFTGRDLADIVQKELTAKLGTRNLGIIARPKLAVLRTAKAPAVIAEIGYMTNKAELRKLKTSIFKQNAAEALKNAVLKALEKMR